ncbi:1-phosphofructokinase family hexose kinase [Parvibaculum sp.]|uniref:1-phosphofructokinase family hexose kinase n=1 Tax=Parvibaculum sp. TaxID=2024848 RepID=UPI002C1C2833|nr:1-phosphofructokinase family hexose kinase [Parvibaculum sp.]HUD50076.1 1-phosphofructokinase family hexose kinase [Parvibaculum sp.]
MTMKIATLTMNPAIDTSTSVAEVMPVHKLRCAAGRRDPGGGGINVARVLRRFGHAATAIYVVGGITGKLLRKLVEGEGIESRIIEADEETREDFTVLEERSGNQFRFVLPGPALSETVCSAALDTISALHPAPEYIVASGSLPQGVPADFYARVVSAGRQVGSRVVVDTSGAALSGALATCPFMVKPSLRELRELTGEELGEEVSMVAAARRLIAEGQTEAVALTLGGEGAVLVTGDGAWRANAPHVEMRSAVGAGDSFVGGMVGALASGDDWEEAFRRGIAAGSAALLSPGTELCRPEDAERLFVEVKTRKIA